MITTKVYKNTAKAPIDVLGLGVIKPGEQVSVTGEYHQPVIVENYPGLVDVLAEEQAEADRKSAEEVEKAKTKEARHE